jgi:hypothetical protein
LIDGDGCLARVDKTILDAGIVILLTEARRLVNETGT